MININSYVLKFGNRTFKKFPFNDVDGLVLAEISMINFDLLIEGEEPVALKDIVLKDYKKVIYGSPDARANGIMLKRMMKSERYKNIKVAFIKRVFDAESALQFYAVTFILPDGSFYISFKGTDITIVGWREDFNYTVSGRMATRDQALIYCNDVISKLPGNYIIGGHSKGGYLAVYSGLNINQEYLTRLLTIYSYDGPGFVEGLERYPNYGLIKDRIKKFITHRDFIGLLYDEVNDSTIVYATGMLLGGHDPYTWKVDPSTGNFVIKEKMVRKAMISSRGANLWLNQLSNDDKELGIKALIAIVGKAQNIYDLLKYLGPNIIRYNSVIKQFPVDERERLRKMIVLFFDCFKLAKQSYSNKPRDVYGNL